MVKELKYQVSVKYAKKDIPYTVPSSVPRAGEGTFDSEPFT